MKYIWKDTFKSIKKSLSKFITLTCIVTLGVSFFVGLQAAPDSMANSIESFDDALNLHDYQIISTLGFEQEDIDALRRNEYIDQVQPYYFLDCYTKIGQSVKVIRLEGQSEGTIDQYEIVEGRDIENKNEIILLSDGSENGALSGFDSALPAIGDKVFVYLDDQEILDSINRIEYEVVGYYRDSKYITKMLDTSTLDAQALGIIGIVDESNFVMEAVPSVMMTLTNASDYNSFSKDYDAFIEHSNTVLDSTFQQGEQNRNDKVIGEANDKLNEAREEYQEGLDTFNKEINDAKQQIQDGNQELSDAYQELMDGQAEFDTKRQEAVDELHDAEKQINDGKEELAKQEEIFKEEKEKALDQLAQAKQTVDAALAQVQQGKDQIKALTEQIQPGFFDNVLYNSTNVQPLIDFGKQQAQAGIIDQNVMLQNAIDLGLVDEYFDNVITSILNQYHEQIDDALVNSIYFPTLKDILITAMIDSKAFTEEEITEAINNKTFAECYKQFYKRNSVAYVQFYLSLIKNPFVEGIINGLLKDLSPNEEITLEILKNSLATLAIGDGAAQYGLEAYNLGYQQAMDQLDSAQEKIYQAKALLIEGSEEVISGWQEANDEFAKAQADIDDGWDQYHEGKQELVDAQKELDDAIVDGQKELDDAAIEIEDAQKEIDDIEPCEWIVLDRGSHYSSVMYHNTISTMTGIAFLFPLFFILVAILVCLTTMTRMVEEERTLIGTYRSLGFSRFQSCSKFIFYALLASILGCVIGSVIGLLIFPIVVYNAWGMMYFNPEFKLVIPWFTIIIISIMFIALMVGTTYMTCRVNMKEVPAQLMRPSAPKNAKKTVIERISFIWNHLNFTMKVTVRNLFRYKKRFFMTVLGVGGCTSLMVCGFGVKDAVSAIGTIQYGQLYKFDGSVSFDNLDIEEFNIKFNQYQQQSSLNSVYPIYFTNVTVKGNVDQSSYLYVVDQKDINNVFDLHDYKTKESIQLSDSGIVVSKRLAQYYDLNVGDTLAISNSENQRQEFVIEGIAEMYIYHHIFMTKAAYENAFDTAIIDNTIAFNANDQQLITQVIQSDSDVSGYNFASDVISFVNNMIDGFGVIMVVLVSSAAALAFVVLGNLTSVNISERLREIATLKVLGFTKKEVHHYVYYENIILTMIGGLLGLWFGKVELSMIMNMIQMDNIAFGSNIQPMSYLISYILTIIFAMFVNIVMQRKLDHIDMVESLKSIE